MQMVFRKNGGCGKFHVRIWVSNGVVFRVIGMVVRIGSQAKRKSFRKRYLKGSSKSVEEGFLENQSS